MNLKIWHNPRCSKSRETLGLLEDKGYEIEVIHYLDNPPSSDALDRVLNFLGMEPRELMRRKEPVYKELGLDGDSLGRAELISAMVSNPVLIERPIVICGSRAAIGRPPEAVLDILSL